MLKFSEFAEGYQCLDGDKIKIVDVINKDICVIGYKVKQSKYQNKGCGRCVTIQIEMEGKRHVLFTGSEVLIDQLEKYGDKIPFETAIKQIDKFFTFS